LISTEELAALQSKGSFTVRVVPGMAWIAVRADQGMLIPWHETVLRPLLSASRKAWVYELKPASDVFEAAKEIVTRESGKYAIDLGGDPITEHELLWNASGGRRGSIVLEIPVERFPASEIYPRCQGAFIVGNSTVPHSPAAIRYARSQVASGETICCLLSRTNGFEWISIFAAPSQLPELFAEARAQIAETQFETERMRCRRWMAEDMAPLMEVYGDAEAMRWVGDGEPLSLEQCKKWLEVTADNYRLRGYGMFALESLQTGKVIGFCGLVHPCGQVEAEIKYAFMRSHWGQGLATEAVAMLLLHGARGRGLTRIIATVAPDNLASQRVLMKAGMTFAHLRQNDDGSTTQVYEWTSDRIGANKN
jgi:[ribosomal protein S5]-alanine N-acetyltransferase